MSFSLDHLEQLLPREISEQRKGRLRDAKDYDAFRSNFITNTGPSRKHAKKMTRKSMEQDIKVEFVPMSPEAQKAFDEMSAKWKQRALERELAEYERLDQYFKDYNESLKK